MTSIKISSIVFLTLSPKWVLFDDIVLQDPNVGDTNILQPKELVITSKLKKTMCLVYV
jgi:hypothetical protein